MRNERIWFMITLAIVCVMPPVHAQREVENAVLMHLKWLSRHQDADGHWSVREFVRQCGGTKTDKPEHYRGACASGVGDAEYDIAVTGFALLSFHGAGYWHGSRQGFDGIPFKDVVVKAHEWLVKRQNAQGVIGDGGKAQMMNHAVATLALCESYRITLTEELKPAAQKAVTALAAMQVTDGSWQSTTWTKEGPRPMIDAMTALNTGFALMALRSAELSGLSFDKERAYSRANLFLDQLIAASDKRDPQAYRVLPVFIMGKMFTGQNADVRNKASLTSAAQELLKHPADVKDPTYTWLATLALYAFDGPGGVHWKQWNESVRNTLSREQKVAQKDEKGSWDPSETLDIPGGRLYATVAGGLSMELYYRYASVFTGLEVK